MSLWRFWDDAHLVNLIHKTHAYDVTLGYRFITDERDAKHGMVLGRAACSGCVASPASTPCTKRRRDPDDRKRDLTRLVGMRRSSVDNDAKYPRCERLRRNPHSVREVRRPLVGRSSWHVAFPSSATCQVWLMGNSRKPRRPDLARMATSEDCGGRLNGLAGRWGPVGETLSQYEQNRSNLLRAMPNDHDTLIRAIGQISGSLRWLTTGTSLPEELSELLHDAQDDLANGVESVLSRPDPRVLDESRHLMEIEALLRLFAREPEELRAWADAEPHRRNQQYGFGKLLDRERREKGVPDGHVLPDSVEYGGHSQAVHPLPRRDKIAPAGDELSGAFADLGDLLQHGARVLDAAVEAMAALLPGDAPGPPSEYPPVDQLEPAWGLIERFNRRLGVPLQDRPISVPRKQERLRGGTYGGKQS